MPPVPSIASTPAPTASEGYRWFRDEVQPHDGQLKAYLRGAFPGVRDVDDVVQESYLRLWKRQAVSPIDSAKAFLFQIARNLAADLLRRERCSPIDSSKKIAELSVIEEIPAAADRLTWEEKAVLLGEALASLPDRCREVVFLHKIKGLSQREVSLQLGLTEKNVANQIHRGVKRCEAFIRHHGREFH